MWLRRQVRPRPAGRGMRQGDQRRPPVLPHRQRHLRRRRRDRPTTTLHRDGGAAAFLHGPERLFANIVTLPTTGPSDAEVSA